MSTKIEALPLPGRKGPSRQMWWVAALLAALLVAGAGTYLALRHGGSGVAPTLSHPVVVPPAAPALQPAEAPAGPRIKELSDVGGVISGRPAEAPSRNEGESKATGSLPSAPDPCRLGKLGPC